MSEKDATCVEHIWYTQSYSTILSEVQSQLLHLQAPSERVGD